MSETPPEGGPTHRPPRWMERVLERALPGGLSGEGTLGDVAEGYEKRARSSPTRARLWYAAQTLSIVTYRVFTGSGADSSGADSDLLMDLRWSLRSTLKHPGFTAGIVAVLGLGLGAVTAVYAVVDGTLKNTSWWADADRAVAIWPGREFSFGHIELYREESTAYRAIGGYVELAYAVSTPDGLSESVNGAFITPELFRELTVQPVVGRALSDDDGFFAGEAVAVIGGSPVAADVRRRPRHRRQADRDQRTARHRHRHPGPGRGRARGKSRALAAHARGSQGRRLLQGAVVHRGRGAAGRSDVGGRRRRARHVHRAVCRPSSRCSTRTAGPTAWRTSRGRTPRSGG